jgi:Ca2+-binding RTX toxin-like protein
MRHRRHRKLGLLLAAALVPAFAVAVPGQASADDPPVWLDGECGPPQVVIFGDNMNNVIVGGVLNDRIFGLDGDDDLYGLEGDDDLHGNSGDDDLYGGPGDDCLHGDEGADRLRGGPGWDRCDGGPGLNDVADATCEVQVRIP